GYPPHLDLEREAALQKAVIELIQLGMVESVHDCSDGGLAVALAEKTFAKGIGARVNLASGGLPAEFVLFGEDASRILLSCDAGKVEGIQRVAGKFGVAADVIGETGSDRVEISLDGAVVVSAAVGELSGDYEGALEAALRAESVAVEA
ncbi:MAG: AIR synthase-related protein, partial [Candidatus Sulfotelmatobacter sp.]